VQICRQNTREDTSNFISYSFGVPLQLYIVWREIYTGVVRMASDPVVQGEIVTRMASGRLTQLCREKEGVANMAPGHGICLCCFACGGRQVCWAVIN
jgi:hypothetical protein